METSRLDEVKIQTEIRKKRMIRWDMEGKILLNLCVCVGVSVCVFAPLVKSVIILALWYLLHKN